MSSGIKELENTRTRAPSAIHSSGVSALAVAHHAVKAIASRPLLILITRHSIEYTLLSRTSYCIEFSHSQGHGRPKIDRVESAAHSRTVVTETRRHSHFVPQPALSNCNKFLTEACRPEADSGLRQYHFPFGSFRFGRFGHPQGEDDQC